MAHPAEQVLEQAPLRLDVDFLPLHQLLHFVFIDEEEFVGACKLLKVEEEMAVGERENLRKVDGDVVEDVEAGVFVHGREQPLCDHLPHLPLHPEDIHRLGGGEQSFETLHLRAP
eukprot:CAMPEP_0180196208 /NCGR_PEP_ID=MMETSP0987-20121128/3992_1 /TAXON_ID=697907 /ORGANISM="non described non described, Strain CCMP2293" /LENGTH=114 /DNA_ID=CAMNT_0022151089 /DNA_START=538 /DNA_END=882 /DNA_ORIENTATION=+